MAYKLLEKESEIIPCIRNEFINVQLQKDRSSGRIIGKDTVNMIKEKHKESYSVSGVYKLLKRMIYHG